MSGAWFRVYSRYLVSATPSTVLTNPSEILQVSLSWSEDVYVLFTESLHYIFFTFFTFLQNP